MNNSEITFHPIISSVQRIALYETKSEFYLVGSNNTETRFRVLRISRREPRELRLHDDKVEYSKNEIQTLLTSIGSKNYASNAISAFGIVGFVRFLEGYYLILITHRTRVAVIGYHTIYKIEYTNMIYIPSDAERSLHPDEGRYVKMFQAIDLSSNFYFSYSYDLTHTLQHNMRPPTKIVPNAIDDEHGMGMHFPDGASMDFAVRFRPHRKFVWNAHLLSQVEKDLHPDWLIYITHGFIGQSNVSVFGRSIYVTLIARRSCKYAGTRFLKRGANFQGDVANEVETEQMAHDAAVSALTKTHFTSFVQMRGSIPGHWRQEMGKIVAKPAITLDLNDPFAETAGAHFNDLLKRYGSPIIVLNLVKQREKKKQEKLLSDEFHGSIKYLNQFLPPEHQIQYKSFDMARKNKANNSNVMRCLAGIARHFVAKTGHFQNRRAYYAQKAHTKMGSATTSPYQTGIIRTNCVDCLDRTNTAQFAIGKCVLGYQLCALGVLDAPHLEFDTDCVRMLESLYEDHGDTLALQYGGSQLVHRVETYRKTVPWTSQGNDIMQTLSRYFSNTFSDAEKQNTINLFLGLFVPDASRPPIWEYPNDYYFHFKPTVNLVDTRLLTQWWDDALLQVLPFALNDAQKACEELIQIDDTDLEMIDAYIDYHRPYTLSVLDEMFAYKICNSIRDFMPNCTTNYSPFTIRIRPGKRREEAGKSNMKNPSLTGQSSTSSTASSTSTDSSDGSDPSEDEISITNESTMTRSHDSSNMVTFPSLFPSMEQVYGTGIKEPAKCDDEIYKRYALIGKKANRKPTSIQLNKIEELLGKTSITSDTSLQVKMPTVSEQSITVFKRSIEVSKNGGFQPSEKDLLIYQNYLNVASICNK